MGKGASAFKSAEECENRARELIIAIASHHVSCTRHVDIGRVRNKGEKFLHMRLLHQFGRSPPHQQRGYFQPARRGNKRCLYLRPIAVDAVRTLEESGIPVPPPTAVRPPPQVLLEALV